MMYVYTINRKEVNIQNFCVYIIYSKEVNSKNFCVYIIYRKDDESITTKIFEHLH